MQLYQNTYKERLSRRVIDEEYQELETLKLTLLDIRMKSLKNETTTDWTTDDLLEAINMTKNNKARDPNGMIVELLKEDFSGPDLRNGLLLLFNGLKEQKSSRNLCVNQILHQYQKIIIQDLI